jgi:hypothetical protein
MREKRSIIASMLLGVGLFAPPNVQAVPLSGEQSSYSPTKHYTTSQMPIVAPQ